MATNRSNLREDRVKEIKIAIVGGMPLVTIVETFEISYMTAYKIAVGDTWKNVEPRGRLIGKREYESRRILSLSKCEAIALAKLKRGLSNARIAKKIGRTESTVRRAVINGTMALRLRIQKLVMRDGINKTKKRFGLTDEQVGSLIKRGSNRQIPEWIKREVERNAR